MGEAFVGLQRHFIPNVATIFGIGVGAIGKTTTNGNVYDDGDPRFKNQAYTSKKSTTYVVAEIEFIPHEPMLWNLKPFIKGGIGAGRNRVSDYKNTSIVCGVAADSNFESNSEWNFGFTVGQACQPLLQIL